MSKKFELTDETVVAGDGTVLYRIRAVEDIPARGVRKGDLGGFVESVGNLSGNAWVYGEAQVSGDARVLNNAQVYGNALVSGDAWVYGNAWVSGGAQVYGNARVYGNAQVSDGARVSDYAQVYGNAQVSGYVWVYGGAQVYGGARVYNDARVYGNARVYGDARVSGNAWVSGEMNMYVPICEYTPTTEEVAEIYFESGYKTTPEQFDRWLASVKAEAWEAGCNAGHNREHHKNMTEEQARAAWPNPYREVKLANSLGGFEEEKK